MSILEYIRKPGFFLIAGPCVVENETMPMEIAEAIHILCKKYDIPFIFKASYKKPIEPGWILLLVLETDLLCLSLEMSVRPLEYRS